MPSIRCGEMFSHPRVDLPWDTDNGNKPADLMTIYDDYVLENKHISHHRSYREIIGGKWGVCHIIVVTLNNNADNGHKGFTKPFKCKCVSPACVPALPPEFATLRWCNKLHGKQWQCLLWMVGLAVKRLNNNNEDKIEMGRSIRSNCIIRGLVNKPLRSPDDIYLILNICTVPASQARRNPLTFCRLAFCGSGRRHRWHALTMLHCVPLCAQYPLVNPFLANFMHRHGSWLLVL